VEGRWAATGLVKKKNRLSGGRGPGLLWVDLGWGGPVQSPKKKKEKKKHKTDSRHRRGNRRGCSNLKD